MGLYVCDGSKVGVAIIRKLRQVEVHFTITLDSSVRKMEEAGWETWNFDKYRNSTIEQELMVSSKDL